MPSVMDFHGESDVNRSLHRTSRRPGQFQTLFQKRHLLSVVLRRSGGVARTMGSDTFEASMPCTLAHLIPILRALVWRVASNLFIVDLNTTATITVLVYATLTASLSIGWYSVLVFGSRSADRLPGAHVDHRSGTAASKRRQCCTRRGASRGRFPSSALADTRRCVC
jgi:hypothetical protein